MSFRAFRMQFAILLSLATAACGGGGGGGGSSPPPPPPPPPLQSQTISFAQQGPLVLMVGSALTNAASGGGGSGAITYQSSNTSVLTVNATSGAATGVGIGPATVTATKAADATFSQAQATYTVNVQTTSSMTAWIGAASTQVFLPDLALGKQFVTAPADTCATPENVATCPNAQSTTLTGTLFTELSATLTTPTYYSLRSGSVSANATLVAAKRFSQRIGHAALFFNNRYWVFGGGEPVLPSAQQGGPPQYVQKEDVWSSADGKDWKLETAHAEFGPRWFHQAVVYNGAMWVISGANNSVPVFSDIFSSTDGVHWIRRAVDIHLPWYSIHLNVVAFNGAMWAVSGGTTYSSTDGVSWTQRSTLGAIAGNDGRGYASLNVYDGSLWYMAGAPGLNAAVTSVVNDVWKSSDGISWTRVVEHAAFAPRFRHCAFVMNGRLWIFGGQVPASPQGLEWALDGWSTTDGVQWTVESTDGLDASFLAKVVEQTGPDRVTLIGGLQRGYANNVWQSTNGREWTALSSNAAFSPRTTRGVSFNGQLWIIGGGATNSSAAGAVNNDIWRSNDGNDWMRITPNGTIFSARDGHGVVVFQNKLWVIGGYDNLRSSGGTETRLNDVWSSSDGVTWAKHEPANGVIFSARVGHDVVVFQDKLWVIGGNDDTATDTNDVWSSPDGITWTQVQPAAGFPARRAHRVVAFKNELWLTGGGSAQGRSEVWRSADGITWTPVNPVPGPFPQRTRHAMTVFNNQLYMVGGVSGEDYLSSTVYNDIWTSDDGVAWHQVAAGPRFAPRWNTALIVQGGELWVIAGFGLNFTNDVWRSSNGVDWRLGYKHDIVVP